MKTLMGMTESAVQIVKRGLELELTSLEIGANVEKFIGDNMKTASGKNRYPNYYGSTMRNAALAVKFAFQDEYTVFGYWYKGDFYTTHSKAKQYGLKSTNYLHNLKPHLTQEEWSGLERGTYYHSLKDYFTPK